MIKKDDDTVMVKTGSMCGAISPLLLNNSIYFNFKRSDCFMISQHLTSFSIPRVGSHLKQQGGTFLTVTIMSANWSDMWRSLCCQVFNCSLKLLFSFFMQSTVSHFKCTTTRMLSRPCSPKVCGILPIAHIRIRITTFALIRAAELPSVSQN